jgi:hypothetical protein
MHTGSGLKNMKGKYQFEKTDSEVRIILKMILEEKMEVHKLD